MTKPDALVQPDRRRVVGADLQENRAAVGEFEQPVEQPPADALALVRRVDADGVDLVLVRRLAAQPGDARVADEPSSVGARAAT